MECSSISTFVLVVITDVFWQFGARLQVIGSTHKQEVAGGVERFQLVHFIFQINQALIKVGGWPFGYIAIAIVEMGEQNAAAVRCGPV